MLWEKVQSVKPGLIGVNQILNRNESEMYPADCLDREAYYVEKILPPGDKAAGETWSFAVAADKHVQYYDRTHNEKFAQLLNSWVKAKVDFAVIVGDLGGPGHHEPFGRQIARTANCPPILVAMGNHEMDRQGKKSWLNAVYCLMWASLGCKKDTTCPLCA